MTQSSGVDLSTITKKNASPLELHLFILGTYLYNWRAYMKNEEELLIKTVGHPNRKKKEGHHKKLTVDDPSELPSIMHRHNRRPSLRGPLRIPLQPTWPRETSRTPEKHLSRNKTNPPTSHQAEQQLHPPRQSAHKRTARKHAGNGKQLRRQLTVSNESRCEYFFSSMFLPNLEMLEK